MFNAEQWITLYEGHVVLLMQVLIVKPVKY